MAKAQKAESMEETSQKPSGIDDNFAPAPELDDWQDVAAERADGWYLPVEGSWFMGRLLGRYEMKKRDDNGKIRAFYQVLVSKASAKMKVGKGDTATEERVPAAKSAEEAIILAFDERASLEVLAPYADNDGVYDVMVECLGKEPIPGTSKSWWNFKTKVKMRKKGNLPLSSRRVDDDIPF